MTVLRHGLVCEDAVCFNQPLTYSVKANEKTIVLKSKHSLVSLWPKEIRDNLKVESLDKYKTFFSQLQAVQKKLTNTENKFLLQMERKMQNRVRQNYPDGSQKVQNKFKELTLRRIKKFKPQFLIEKDERFAKHSRPLFGYLT